MLKCELVRGIVISNTCVKLYRNWIINEVPRAGEHTNKRTYVLPTYSHTYVRDRPYIPSTTLLCEGIMRTCVICKAQVPCPCSRSLGSKVNLRGLWGHLLTFLVSVSTDWSNCPTFNFQSTGLQSINFQCIRKANSEVNI